MTAITIEQLKDLLSTYGVNDEERNAPVLITINGMPTPIVSAKVDYLPWSEGNKPLVMLSVTDNG